MCSCVNVTPRSSGLTGPRTVLTRKLLVDPDSAQLRPAAECLTERNVAFDERLFLPLAALRGRLFAVEDRIVTQLGPRREGGVEGLVLPGAAAPPLSVFPFFHFLICPDPGGGL